MAGDPIDSLYTYAMTKRMLHVFKRKSYMKHVTFFRMFLVI